MGLISLGEMRTPQDRIIASFDQDTWEQAESSMAEYADLVGLGKINSLVDAVGAPESVRRLAAHGLLAMMDLKIYDVDDTMRRRTREQTLAGSAMITIHAANTVKALKQAVVGREQALAEDPKLRCPWLLGVTVLTSIDDRGNETCVSIFGANRRFKVRQFAHAAADAGFDGLVCSPWEAGWLKNGSKTQHMKLVVPAIRPPYAVKRDEQATAATPGMAIRAGADFLVVGRPLMQASLYGLTGRDAAQLIASEICDAH